LLAACEREYGLTIGPPFVLSYNYVAPVTLHDGGAAVLKLSPHGEEFLHELRATKLFNGRGMARLLASDADRGIALLERLLPGQMLVELDDDERQTLIAADVIAELQRQAPPEHGLPTVREWFVAFAKYRAEHGPAGPLPRGLFERGEAMYQQLMDSYMAPPVLLHGDLHHYNILSAQRAPWLAIDPHGLVGEPAFEIGAYFGNPSDLAGKPGLRGILERRADIFAERLGFDRARVLAWAMSYQVLSAVWSTENGGTEWERAAHVAETLATMQR
jgi:streptomycin 6-kinase